MTLVPTNGEKRPPAKLSRRELLTGRLSKLFAMREKTGIIRRFPISSGELAAAANVPRLTSHTIAPTKSISGIAIEPIKTQPLVSAAASCHTLPLFRPPGAVDEQRFMADCTRCNACLDACPHDAIVHAPPRLGAVAGTPIVNPDTQPCVMCDDFPCISACEPGVLSRQLPKVMGTAQITRHLCLARQGTTCSVCSERCPVEGAIAIVDGLPTIREELCSGCGVCRFVCPAPENAILLMPTFSRPLR